MKRIHWKRIFIVMSIAPVLSFISFVGYLFNYFGLTTTFSSDLDFPTLVCVYFLDGTIIMAIFCFLVGGVVGIGYGLKALWNWIYN